MCLLSHPLMCFLPNSPSSIPSHLLDWQTCTYVLADFDNVAHAFSIDEIPGLNSLKPRRNKANAAEAPGGQSINSPPEKGVAILRRSG